MLTNDHLEYALHYAGGDKSLKAIARRESERADGTTRLLTAVLSKVGPVALEIDGRQYLVAACGDAFTIEQKD